MKPMGGKIEFYWTFATVLIFLSPPPPPPPHSFRDKTSASFIHENDLNPHKIFKRISLFDKNANFGTRRNLKFSMEKGRKKKTEPGRIC